jgi:hypothetical protein
MCWKRVIFDLDVVSEQPPGIILVIGRWNQILRCPAGDSAFEVERAQHRQTGENGASAREVVHYANDPE